MRDIEKEPYSADEKRVAEWYMKHDIGGGDDPIGNLIASHEYLAQERNRYREALRAIRDEKCCGLKIAGIAIRALS